MPNRQLVLVVEDDVHLLGLYQDVLNRAGYVTRCVRTGRGALKAVKESRPDLVILDIGLDDDVSGFDVLSKLRRRGPNTRIMIVSGLGDEANLVHGLSLGADNYLLKPVSEAHLLARVRTQLNLHRDPVAPRSGRFRYGDLIIDLGHCQLIQNDRRWSLSNTEIKVLTRLLHTFGQAVTNEELMTIWGEANRRGARWFNIRPLSHCIYRLREKLKPGDGRELIETVRLVGFLILEPDETLSELEDLEEEWS